MASLVTAPTANPSSIKKNCRVDNRCIGKGITVMRIGKSLEELYNVKVERKVPQERLSQLGVSQWSVWKTGKCRLPWDWQVDQLVYVEEGEVRVVPEGSKDYMRFVAGDLIRYPKWFEADLFFNGFYQERYSFRAYGDDY